MDASLILTFVLDLDLSCRGSGIPKFAEVCEIGNLTQATAKNSDENLMLYNHLHSYPCLHSGFVPTN